MKAETKQYWVTSDGKSWDEQAQAFWHERKLALLGIEPDSRRWSIQLFLDKFEKIMNAFVAGHVLNMPQEVSDAIYRAQLDAQEAAENEVASSPLAAE